MSGQPGRRQVPRFEDRQPCPPVRNAAWLDTRQQCTHAWTPILAAAIQKRDVRVGQGGTRPAYWTCSGRHHPPPEKLLGLQFGGERRSGTSLAR